MRRGMLPRRGERAGRELRARASDGHGARHLDLAQGVYGIPCASMASRFGRNPRVACVAAATIALVWINQGPSFGRYEELANEAKSGAHPLLRAWMPLAFAYRRSADEELYFAIANAIRGAPFDRHLLLAKR